MKLDPKLAYLVVNIISIGGAMKIKVNAFKKGFAGEREVRRMLETALGCTVLQYEGDSDMGLDLHVQMENPYGYGELIQFDVQVKTGNSHVTEEPKRYKIKKSIIASGEWSKLKRSKTPVLFIWLKEDDGLVAYWQFVKPSASHSHFYISKHKTISPVSRYDIARELGARERIGMKERYAQMFCGNIGRSIRLEAKIVYKTLMITECQNPFLGKTKITWHGWRHITNQSRAQYDIFKSLIHIYSIPACIERPDMITGFRRVSDVIRGNRVNCVRLVVFEKKIKLKKTKPLVLVCVLRELIDYPKDWRSYLLLENEIKRTVIFESIYEKKEEK